MEAIKKKRFRVHRVPTEGESHLGLSASGAFDLTYFKELRKEDDDTVLFHLYYTSDDEIKEGDWKLNPTIGHIVRHVTYSDGDRKIEVSTDPKLNLPQPSQDTIKAYCEKPFEECDGEM